MKNLFKARFTPWLIIIALVTVIGFGFVACDNGGGGGDGGGDQTPSTPEPMTSQSALQYFTSEGVKMGWNLGNHIGCG